MPRKKMRGLIGALYRSEALFARLIRARLFFDVRASFGIVSAGMDWTSVAKRASLWSCGDA